MHRYTDTQIHRHTDSQICLGPRYRHRTSTRGIAKRSTYCKGTLATVDTAAQIQTYATTNRSVDAYRINAT